MQQILSWLTGDGGILRVRGMLALLGLGTLSYMAVDGTLAVEVYVGIVGPIVGFYAGQRAASTTNGS